MDNLDSRGLAVPGEDIQNGKPRLVRWIVFKGMEQFI